MPQITDICPQKGKARFNIYLDGKFAFGLSAEALLGLRSHFGEGGAKAGLAVGQEISQEEIEKLVKENEFIKIYDRVLKFLSYRPRSSKEILNWFDKKQVGKETKSMVLKKLRNLDYINDEEFARWWIEQRVTFRPTGFRLLVMELRQKGIPKEVIDNLKSEINNLKSEKELAKKVAEKKLKSLRHLSGLELRQKLSNALARRGFSWETIKIVIDEIREKE